MDRIEAYEEEIESESTTALQRLKTPSLSRFHIKSASNINHERNRALAAEISQCWAIPIPRIMRLFKTERYKDRYDYEQIFDAFEQTKKTEDCYRPWGLFLWKLKNAKSN